MFLAVESDSGFWYIFYEYVVDACKWFNEMKVRGEYEKINAMLLRLSGLSRGVQKDGKVSFGHNDLKCANGRRLRRAGRCSSTTTPSTTTAPRRTRRSSDTPLLGKAPESTP